MNGIVYKKTYNSPKLNIKEALRYAGIKLDDKGSEALLLRCFAESDSQLSYKACMCRYAISVSGDVIDLGFCSVKSHSLAICLAECSEILLFCATIGNGIDRLIEKSRLTSPAKAVMMDALGSERVESLCDMLCDELFSEVQSEGFSLRPRFSPGYGDLSLDIQREIFASLNPTAKIGVILNENLFMSPTKSVTAIVGIKKG